MSILKTIATRVAVGATNKFIVYYSLAGTGRKTIAWVDPTDPPTVLGLRLPLPRLYLNAQNSKSINIRLIDR